MYLFISIFFVAFLTCPILTAAPPARLGAAVRCGGRAETFVSPTTDDCIGLLHAIRNEPWVQEKTKFGLDVPDQGTVPINVTYRTCRFKLAFGSEAHLDPETFRLVKYFPDIYRIITQCFEEDLRCREGMVGVGERGIFAVRLSAWHNPESTGREIVVQNGLNLTIAGNEATTA